MLYIIKDAVPIVETTWSGSMYVISTLQIYRSKSYYEFSTFFGFDQILLELRFSKSVEVNLTRFYTSAESGIALNLFP